MRVPTSLKLDNELRKIAIGPMTHCCWGFSLFNRLSQLIGTLTYSDKVYFKILIDHNIYSVNASHILETCVPVIGVSDRYAICCTWSKRVVKIPKVGHTYLT